MSSPTEGVRIVRGRNPIFHLVGCAYTGAKGSMIDRVRRGEFSQIHTPLTIEFNPKASYQYPLFYYTTMKSTALLPPPAPPTPKVAQGDLLRYVGPASSSMGEIVIALSETSAVVIHSVSPSYPLGHLYSSFTGPGSRYNEWQPVPEATITYSR